MDLREAFVRSIAESLYDDTPRLVYADWLEDHGEQARAEFIRVQCELEPMRDLYEIDRAAELHRREDELQGNHYEEWLGPALEGSWERNSCREDGASVHLRRGFVDTMLMPVRTFLTLGTEARRLHPTIRRMVLFRVNGYGKRLARCKALEGLAELELACWYSDADAKAIASSPHLSQLRVLELWLGRADGLTDGRLCRIMAGSKAWPRLRDLTLLNPDGDHEQGRKELATMANEAAGRKVAVTRRGYPELFPFAADSRYAFSGYLPDGRLAMAQENDRTTPPNLTVITFDKTGKQTDEILTLPLPDDSLAIPESDWFRHRANRKQHLIDTLGFRPGFIRIQSGRFPWDLYGGFSPYRGHEDSWDLLGCPDSDDEVSWREEQGGNGGRITKLVREGGYVIGGDWWADKRGQVHST